MNFWETWYNVLTHALHANRHEIKRFALLILDAKPLLERITLFHLHPPPIAWKIDRVTPGRFVPPTFPPIAWKIDSVVACGTPSVRGKRYIKCVRRANTRSPSNAKHANPRNQGKQTTPTPTTDARGPFVLRPWVTHALSAHGGLYQSALRSQTLRCC